MSRIEKVRLISDFEQSYDWLLVCWLQIPNCGKCGKCIRTMLELDFVGKLERYRTCFDLDEYFKNRDKYLRLIVRTKERDHFMTSFMIMQLLMILPSFIQAYEQG